MKVMAIAALSLLLVLVCVVMIRHERSRSSLKVSPVVPQAGLPAARKPMPLPKPGPTGPIDITGPLKDRPLISWVLPEYPEWALEQGISGVYSVKIWVSPDGAVQSFRQPERLSADPRLDEKASEAISQWRFAEKPESFGNQWGVVTVRFSILSQQEANAESSIRGASLRVTGNAGVWRCVREWFGKEYRYYCRLVKPSPSTQAQNQPSK